MTCWAQREAGKGPLVKWVAKDWGGPWVEAQPRLDKRRRARKPIHYMPGSRLEDKGIVGRY